MANRIDRSMAIGIGTTFDYSLPFELTCRMIAKAGFRAITIGGGDIAHSGYDTADGRAMILAATAKHKLTIDSVHAPFGPDADLSVPDIRTEIPGENANPTSDVRTIAAQPATADPLDSALPTEVRAFGEQPPVFGPRFSYKPAEQRLRALERVKMAIDAAAALGSGIVIVHACDRFPAEETRARINAAKDSFKQLVRHAGERNVRLALENLASPLSMQVFETVLEHVPGLGVCYDTSHAQVAGDTFGVMARHPARIIALHLSDNRGANDDHLLPFEGILPWEEFAYYLPRLRNLGCFMLEVEIRESAFKDRGEFLAEAFRRARQVLDLTPADRQLPTAHAR
jgi:sugar phosphate isomerase/epimerase